MKNLATLCILESIPALALGGGMTGSFLTSQGIPPRCTGELLLEASCKTGRGPALLRGAQAAKIFRHFHFYGTSFFLKIKPLWRGRLYPYSASRLGSYKEGVKDGVYQLHKTCVFRVVILSYLGTSDTAPAATA